MNLDDTIVAIATPPGRGGIGVVRLSGPESRAIATPMLRLRHALEAGRASFGELIEPAAGERIDEAVVTFFAKPHSYTTDDVVEISAHGSPVVLRHIVEIAMARGARLAEPGEFTMRAFLNGRLDLTQAEAVRDLIDSQTLYQAKVAAQQLEGALSNRLKPVKKNLVDLIAALEAGVDFAEDDVPVMQAAGILPKLAAVREPLTKLAESFAYGKVVHEGITLAIVGRPNVGKSSLFNRLVERERAIVTATPGTTRDLVSETVSLGGIPIKLVDTAGLRASSDEAESIGIRKSYEALADSDLVLVVVDAASFSKESGRGDGVEKEADENTDREFLKEFQKQDKDKDDKDQDERLLRAVEQRKAILVANKIDLASGRADYAPGNGDAPQHAMKPQHNMKIVRTSAITGEGIAELRSEILHRVSGAAGGQQESGFLTNARQQALVNEALRGLDAAGRAVKNNIPHEMLLLDLYSALRPLDSITGETTADDILNLIFSSFCIGK